MVGMNFQVLEFSFSKNQSFFLETHIYAVYLSMFIYIYSYISITMHEMEWNHLFKCRHTGTVHMCYFFLIMMYNIIQSITVNEADYHSTCITVFYEIFTLLLFLPLLPALSVGKFKTEQVNVSLYYTLT